MDRIYSFMHVESSFFLSWKEQGVESFRVFSDRTKSVCALSLESRECTFYFFREVSSFSPETLRRPPPLLGCIGRTLFSFHLRDSSLDRDYLFLQSPVLSNSSEMSITLANALTASRVRFFHETFSSYGSWTNFSLFLT